MKTGSDKSVVSDAERLGGAEKESAFVKCGGCGGNMVFDPETQCLKCEHCGRVDDFGKSSEVEELAIEDAFEKSEKWNDEVSVYRCSNCGAVFNIRADEVSAICPYCSTTHIVKSEDLAGVKPNALYPFVITSQKAVELSKKWAKKKIFAPTSFKKSLEESNLRGLYLPSFTFDSNTVSYYEGRLGERRTRTVRTSDGKTRTETYIKWHYVKGTFNKFFDDVLISSGVTPQKEVNRLMPFRKETIRVYEKEYLSGFTAGHYVRDVGACWNNAKSIIDSTLRQDILRHYGYDVIDYLNVSTRHLNVTYKYVMLPVYRLNFYFKRKDYNVCVNGNTGKIIGKTPVSPWRILAAIGIGIAACLGLALLASGSEDCSAEYYNVGERVEVCAQSEFARSFGDYCEDYEIISGDSSL